MFKGAIFDLDGTLLDSMPIWQSLAEIYLNSKGLAPEPGLNELLWNKSLEESARYFQERYGIPDDVETIMADSIAMVEARYIETVMPKDGAEELLAEIADLGIPMVLASTGYPALIEPTLARLDLRKYFGEIFTCTTLNTTKRVPFIYETAADFLGCAPGEILVFEDVIHAIRTANGAGFLTVGVEDAASSQDKEAIVAESDYYISDLTDRSGFWAWAKTL